MNEWTALPNLHPAIVHFPIALVPAALLFEIAAWIRRRDTGLVRAAVFLNLLAALGAGGAYLAGRQAEDSLVGVPAEAQGAIAAHADAALVALVAISTVALLRLLIAARDHRALGRPSTLGRAVGVVGGGIAFALIGLAADRGGALVFRHGVAVAPRVTTAEKAVEPTEPVPSPVTGPSEPATAEPMGGAETSRTFEVHGTMNVPLEGEPGDVVLEVELDLSGFEGTVALLHHVGGDSDLGAFELDTDGTMRLLVLRGTEEKVLATGRTEASGESVRLGVSAAGRHLKGLVDGATVVHGHAEPGAGRGVALRFVGNGTVGVSELRVTPLSG